MKSDFEKKLERYVDLTLQVGINLQPNQRLLIGVPIYNTGVPLEAAPFVKLLVKKAYKMGARLVEVIWGDDKLLLSRFIHADPNTLEEVPSWQSAALLQVAEQGGAILTVLGNDPDLLKNQDPEQVAKFQQAVLKQTDPAMDYVRRSAINWSVIAVPTPGWAAKVLPHLPPDHRIPKLWDTIFQVCRLNEEDPVAAWKEKRREMEARCGYLNEKRYSSLRFTAPGTDITVGLPEGHLWGSASMIRQDGLPYLANLPTEEIFTLPHKAQASGVVTSSMPLSYGGALMEQFSLHFKDGKVVGVDSKRGKTVLQRLVDTDEGSSRLGEIALVPHSSPIAQTGLLFYNILLDENAATHFALGSAYLFSLEGGADMTEVEFSQSGGNRSLVHMDFMIGSDEMDVDGVARDGTVEPVMRLGDWDFKV
jgi:aminopeptidase